MTTYANRDQVLATFNQAPKDEARLARLDHLLGVATDELIHEAGRDYFRHPALVESGGDETETWLADGDGTAVLHQHQGIVSLESIEIYNGSTWDILDPANGLLLGADPDSGEPVPQGEPYFHVRLSPWPPGAPGTWRATFPRYRRWVRLTGVRGWPAIPADLVEACIERARQLFTADATFTGSVAGPEEYQVVTSTDRLPTAFWRFMRTERERFWCHL